MIRRSVVIAHQANDGGSLRHFRAIARHAACARCRCLSPEDHDAETEQRWYEREWWKGELEQGRQGLESQQVAKQERQQCAKRFVLVALRRLAECLWLLQLDGRTTRHRAWYDVTRFDAGRARLADG